MEKNSLKRFMYLTEVDLSIDNGPGINEREFVRALLGNHANQMTCLVPFPERPEIYSDPNIEYVINCRRFHHSIRWIAYLIYIAATFVKVRKLNGRYRFHALVFRLGLTPLLPLVLSYFLRIPIMLKTLSSYSPYLEGASWKARVVRVLLRPFYRLLMRRTKIADTVSIPHVDWLEWRFGLSRDRIVFVPNGANIEIFTPGDAGAYKAKLELDHFEKVVGYVGALSGLRHLEALINSFASLVNSVENAGLVIVGDGVYRTALRALAVQRNLGPRIVFAGSVPYSRVPDYMRAFDVAVDVTFVPVKVRNAIKKCSYSQKIPQYLSCGLPVVAWDVMGNQFLREQRVGELVKIGDVDGLARSLASILGMEEIEREAVKRRARACAEKYFSISELAAQRLDLWVRSTRWPHV